MKHYGGFSYAEIGIQMGCPEGTVRRRVWQAVHKLRTVLNQAEEEMMDMTSRHIRGTRLLDHLYGSLPKGQSEKILKHLNECSSCKAEADCLQKIISALDEFEGDYKVTRVIDISEDGVALEYSWWSTINDTKVAADVHWWTINKDHIVDYIMYQGQEWKLEVLPATEEQYVYEAVLPTPVRPGETIECAMVMHSTSMEDNAQYLGDGKWRYFIGTTPNSDKEWVQVLCIRIPEGASLISTSPEPTTIKTNGTTTLVWRSLLPKVEPRPDGSWPWQFECTVEYHFYRIPAKQPIKEAAIYPKASSAVSVNETVFKVYEKLFGTGIKETALELYNQADSGNYPYPRSWFMLGSLLLREENYTEAMEAFEHAKKHVSGRSPWSQTYELFIFTAIVCQGHILDILGQRDKALKKYQAALVYEPEQVGTGWLNTSYCEIKIDRDWVEDRLKTPFQKEQSNI